MPRKRKAQVEGAVAAAGFTTTPNETVVTETAHHPDPVAGDDDKALNRIVASFKKRFPDDWEAMALSPLQYGLDAMAAKLKGG